MILVGAGHAPPEQGAGQKCREQECGEEARHDAYLLTTSRTDSDRAPTVNRAQ